MQHCWLWTRKLSASPKRIGTAAFCTLLICCLLTPVAAFAASVAASIDRDSVAIGDVVTLTLAFEGGSPKTQPVLPNVPGLRVQFGGKSSQYSWINGETKSTTTYTYALAPTQPGDYNVPAMEIKVGDETLNTPSFAIKAVRNDTAQPDANNADQQLVLVKLIAPKRPVFIGEAIPVELDIYIREGVLNVQNLQNSPFAGEGFTFSGKQIQTQRRVVRIGNANFQLFPFVTTATAVKTGTLTLNAVDTTMVLELPTQNNRQRDAFDPFGMFNHNEQRRVTLSTEAATVEVLPMPAGAPADFAGAVGSYTLNLTAAPTNVTAGDPVTVTVAITGRGAIDSLTLPTPASWEDFKVYPPTSKVETTDQLGLQGTKSFELVVVPQSPEIHELPPLTFSYFDPEQKTYRTIKPPGVKLSVRPGTGGTTLLTANPTPENKPPTQDIVPIKQRLGSLAHSGRTYIQKPTFWLVNTVPALAWLTLLVRRKKLESLANNPRLRRQRAVAAIVASGLEELKQLAAKNDSGNFFATLFRLLQEQLGERLDVPASSITESVIEEHLQPVGVPAAVLKRLEELFQACNQARYAPIKSSHELAAFIPRLETALREIREVNA